MKRITKKEKKQEENNTIEQEFKEYKNITFDNELSKDNSFIEQAKSESGKIKIKNKKKYKEKIKKRESIFNDDEVQKSNVTIKRKVNKKRIGIIILLTIGICVYLTMAVYHLIKNPTDSVMVNEGSISQEETADGYIIRDETVIKGENYKNGMVEIKSEGSKVASGDPVFRYYSSGEEDLKNKIAELDIKIQEAIEKNNENLPSSDTRLLDTQIEATLNEVTNANNIQKITKNKNFIYSFVHSVLFFIVIYHLMILP